ncbi:hypothetical protein B0H12DRAFT_1085523 [Mycena haematopus]|nr:hypothetical protein B0H12DRAFT_1085523 [Mycena haematopus]
MVPCVNSVFSLQMELCIVLSALSSGSWPRLVYKSMLEAIVRQRVGLTEDEGSIVGHPSKTATWGARRRRSHDSRTVPKELSTSILCDTRRPDMRAISK